MKAKIDNGVLVVIAGNSTEQFALEQWQSINVNSCTLQTNGANLLFPYYKKYHRSLKHRIQLFMLNHKLIK